jgi:acyl-coenzyme A thioesterase PaaI-like protein
MHFCEASVYCINEDGEEELIAKATTTMAIIRP